MLALVKVCVSVRTMVGITSILLFTVVWRCEASHAVLSDRAGDLGEIQLVR